MLFSLMSKTSIWSMLSLIKGNMSCEKASTQVANHIEGLNSHKIIKGVLVRVLEVREKFFELNIF